jgi:dimethylaniline monooxygenase (N-oxide forming)
MNVAIIGAGGAGLVTMAELRKLGHTVTAFESESMIGGTWNYETSSRTSVYKNLRTNLPRELMAFTQYKMRPKDDPEGSFTGDARRFASHSEITGWLKSFNEEMGLNEFIRFNTEVKKTVKVDD